MKTTYTILAGLVAQQAAATWEVSGKPFLSPTYANNECTDQQKTGFNWSDLKDGATNFQYGEFDFSKDWKCSSALGKRDGLTKRTFGNKAITNRCSKQKPATFGCDKKKDGFSITTVDISVEFDVMLDLHYTLVDGSLCKQKSVPCKKDGNTIENTQCGGAKSVDVYLGSSYKGEKDCGINLHQIGFNCSPPKPYTPPSPPSPPPVASSHVIPPTVQSSSATCSGVACGSKPPASSNAPPASSAPQSTPATSEGCNGGYGQGCPPVQTSSVQSPPVISSRPPFANSSMPMPPPTYQTSIVTPPSKESSTVTPVQESSAVATPPAKASSVSPCNGGYGSDCGASSAPLASSTVTPVDKSSSAPPAQSSSPTYPPSSYPPKEVGQVLPTCMNTWLQITTECKDNTNTECYCKNTRFTKAVIECVSARCSTDEETKKTLQYLVGICAEHVPENPSIVTDCPKDTFDNTPATPSAPAAPSTPVTSTVVVVTSTGSAVAPPANTPAPPAPAPPAASYPVTTIVYGSTSLTVPAVHFTTETPVAGATPTAPVGLVPGVAPPSTPAATTPAAGGAPYPIASTLRPSVQPTGTGALRPSSPAQFTGAASPLGVEANFAMLGAALAFFAL
jgi:hypothetical protein